MSETRAKINMGKIGWIDGVRGLSALFVMTLHYFHMALLAILQHQVGAMALGHSPQAVLRQTIQFMDAHAIHSPFVNGVAPFILGYWDLGKIGVVMFFMVSGFVIPFSLFKYQKPLKAFLISRFFRLYPLYWLSLILIILAGPTIVPAFGWMKVLANFTMFHKFIHIHDLNGVAWTLQIELAFYILALLLFYARSLKSYKANLIVMTGLMLLATALAWIRHHSGWEAPIALPLGITMMFWGYLWRKVLLREETIPKWALVSALVVFIPLLMLVCYWGYHSAMWTYMNTYLIAMGFFVLFSTRFQLNNAVLRYVGQISYSVYLLHVLIGSNCIRLMVALTPSLYIAHSWLILAPILVGFVVTIGVSSLTYYGVEAPCVTLSKRMIGRIYHTDRPTAPQVV